MRTLHTLSIGLLSLTMATVATAGDPLMSAATKLPQAAQAPGIVTTIIPGVEHPEIPLEKRMQQAVEQIKIDEVVSIPIRSLKAIYSEGQITYMSDNGRYALRGELIDVWQNKTLDTIGQVRDSVERLGFENMGMPITDLNTLTLQSSNPNAPVVTAFVDPNSDSSRAIVKDARALSKDYTFYFVVVPALGPDSIEAAKRLSCVADRNAALSAFEAGKALSLEVSQDCDMKTFTQTLVAADLMGVNGVPFLVAPNGTIGRGQPADLGAWILEHTAK